ncbi:SGNH/GDSL hydrolase family protein [uncultured Shewanella sp.]|uniref:SGNH/GDSL hydrolase family protein n=1 Tax=uncultured Shewanella sp. TaxID=173975 RepID=UPI00263462D1|nr:SGNH/GDSL hydrolase family protein [uncultured Shewanella sp.]
MILKNTFYLTLCLLPFSSFAANSTLSSSQISTLQSNETYTYLRCWYRPSDSHDDVATDWEWGLNDDGSYYKVTGYWYSSISWKNMFYTSTSQDTLLERCQKTLDTDYAAADITFFAADTRFSYNQTIWTNDISSDNDDKSLVNKVVSFGDSISDTGNLYNASQWLFPNDNSWFLGHFSNGYVWTEYVSQLMGLPLYNWAISGAAGEDQYVILPGVTDQIDSYVEYMQLAENYDPKDSLVTLEFGLNDFVNYDRSVAEVSGDFTEIIEKLIDSGITNMLVLNLPDASHAPQFKYSSADKAIEVKDKIMEYNAFIKNQIENYQDQGYNFVLFDTYTLFDNVIDSPESYGLTNVTDSCLDINRSSSVDYLKSHSLRSDCVVNGSDSYLFWGVTHPTTQAHYIIAEQIVSNALSSFTFKNQTAQ